MKKFWKKKIDVPPVVSDPCVELPVFPVGAPLIAGGDKVYAVAVALDVAAASYEEYRKHAPKQAAALAPVCALWRSLQNEIFPYLRAVQESNR